MKTSFDLVADSRDVQGKGASRRLRRSGKVPAILYGGHQEPKQILLDHQNLLSLLVNEKFFSTILSVKIDGQPQAAILKDVQRHPAKNQILHMDLQRVLENEQIRMTIPLHFKGASVSPGVKTQGGVVSHLLNEVEVACLPKDLPEYLEIDLSNMEINQIRRLSDLPLPEGVELVALTHGRDEAVVSIHHPRAEEAAAETPAAAAAAPAGAAPAAAASGGDAKKAAAAPTAAKGGAPKK
ncbi:50S ribosomal protein L25/general stress protein Ctc [Steroidobacter sp. S1-65]|uniref:Large ribosomal subunit protein bL25 n=1 Tax=Steroidobacter gossypii TaxID=2805490 RepID=A0ABS1X3I0_9GAMM|nr:50S ribosomal protein L25/general stress protein Ctc [Steroidobacter gossypii]MBM0107767.1 50S ribosomal protein L25/general stress protein Ctc [Steroidobacter gossypii]